MPKQTEEHRRFLSFISRFIWIDFVSHAHDLVWLVFAFKIQVYKKLTNLNALIVHNVVNNTEANLLVLCKMHQSQHFKLRQIDILGLLCYYRD